MIRGGYGIYYEIGNGDESNANGAEGNPPVANGPTLYNLVGYGSIQPISSPSSEPIGPGFFQAIPLHQKYPSVQQFSFGVQHEFPGRLSSAWPTSGARDATWQRSGIRTKCRWAAEPPISRRWQDR